MYIGILNMELVITIGTLYQHSSESELMLEKK